MKECAKKKSNHDQLYIYRASNSCKRIYKPRILHFDTDSFTISVDDHCSYCICNNSDLFITDIIQTTNTFVKGINGDLPIRGRGNVRWRITDDQGKVHSLSIKGVLYVPSAPMCMVSSQYWGQQANDHTPKPEGTRAITESKSITLEWNQRKYIKTIPYCKRTNTGRFQSAPNTHKHRLFCGKIDDKLSSIKRERVMYCTEINQSENCENLFDPNEKETRKINNIEEDENNITAQSDQAELLRWHYKLGHLSFIRLQYLAKLGILPRKLITVKPPICSGCLYGAMYRIHWRRKGKKGNKIREATEPGQGVSIDQMESTIPGLVAQFKGRLTTQRYNSATVFVDHYSKLSYIHLQTSLSSLETEETKRAFEAFSKERGVRIQHYHADNGRFVDNLFIKSV